jgi:hypothetical protein
LRTKSLKDRLDRLSGSVKPEVSYELQARNSWIVDHLTQSEEDELIEAFQRLDKLRPGQATEAELDAVYSITAKAQERADKDPGWEEYRRKFLEERIERIEAERGKK